ncbi:hypothetical protein EWB00_006041 [Schistosoma japonicum]|uniref:Uncharacterized protein n=1 Tax=Schistosoma japonicum TaxID=6182 RepID=C1LH34_SCHJA|nr:hypothetical protein KSF78_0001466 [Schistosoma japonicum]TNN19853.1 hypothetical protein EWB00_006041 [Schistosoma japonicum]TNN19854.1 hypothetical protein EWB00_006041 [Schistosoma japonicum]TNN19855.1 hypothetical protein EWB00_006041 [Schistosoma japonicum]CAX74012.1 hypothetical protein [Schistosoma japonicum]
MIKMICGTDKEHNISVLEVVRNELKQTVPSQPVYKRFGGNIFFPVSRTIALMKCEEELMNLRSAPSQSETNKK